MLWKTVIAAPISATIIMLVLLLAIWCRRKHKISGKVLFSNGLYTLHFFFFIGNICFGKL